ANHQPFWRRFYLDIALAVICVLAYVDLSLFGGLSARTELGQTASSPVLFAAPALLLLAGGLLVLRAFPVAAGLGARLAARARGAVGMLAFSQVSRSATGPMRLALLLALGVGLGLFALTFTTSLTHNGGDRAAYQVGADFRVVVAQTLAGGDATRAQGELAALPGAPGVTPVFRGSAQVTLNQGGLPVAVLAVDPSTWPQVAGATSWRADYASASLSSLMTTLQARQWPAGTAGQTTATGISSLGGADHPVAALVTAAFAATQHLQQGQTFQLALASAAADQTVFVVAGIIQDFPTYYPGQTPGGLIVVGISDLAGIRGSPPFGPNEFWLRAPADPAQRTAFTAALARLTPNLSAIATVDRQQLRTAITDSPLQTGMRGLLAAGVVLAVALALLGSIVQAALSARKRAVQFAVLRSLGMRTRQLSRLLLGEQAVVYLFGLVGGTLLGAVLATATLPYLQFNDAALDATTVGVPADRLFVDPLNIAIFYAALLVAFLIGLVVTSRAAARIGLGKTLRLGED
ncbi:MAG TPA: ABC transporter permease, partial [Ktedonobacterales bacterium]|nr:ABC transporter permease [Ktedonobacterales bacterium]